MGGITQETPWFPYIPPEQIIPVISFMAGNGLYNAYEDYKNNWEYEKKVEYLKKEIQSLLICFKE